MSKDAVAGVYTKMLTDQSYRKSIVGNPKILDTWDLTKKEKTVLLAEAGLKEGGASLDTRPVLAYFASDKGPMLSPPIAAALGIALNQAAGLPEGALQGPGFLTKDSCCPWGHPVVA